MKSLLLQVLFNPCDKKLQNLLWNYSFNAQILPSTGGQMVVLKGLPMKEDNGIDRRDDLSRIL